MSKKKKSSENQPKPESRLMRSVGSIVMSAREAMLKAAEADAKGEKEETSTLSAREAMEMAARADAAGEKEEKSTLSARERMEQETAQGHDDESEAAWSHETTETDNEELESSNLASPVSGMPDSDERALHGSASEISDEQNEEPTLLAQASDVPASADSREQDAESDDAVTASEERDAESIDATERSASAAEISADASDEDVSPANTDAETTDSEEDVVSFHPGASVIDMSSLRGEIDDDSASILEEMEQDPELQKDVLEGFSTEENDAELEKLSASVKKATDKQNKEYAKLAKQVASELNEDLEAANAQMIAEDQVLEATKRIEDAEAAAAAEAAEAKSKGKKAKKSIRAQKADKAAFDAPTENADGTEPVAAAPANGKIAIADLSDEEVTEDMSEEDAELKAALPHTNENGEYNLDDLQSCIEALLFYSDRPVSLKRLKEMLEMTDAEDEPMKLAIEQLKAAYQTSAHGFEVAEIAGGYQLRTKPSKAALLRKLAKVQVQRLSRGAMESLTIVAYKQPCTKDDIDQVRGVDSSHFIRTLLDRRLIEITGRSESAGRPMIYATTDHFLEVFGIMDLSALPPLREIEAMVPGLAAQEEGAEDPRVIQMRKMVQQMKADATALDYNPREDDKILSEIRERVKTIDITTPYLARQKELAEQGITGSDAEDILAKEFGFYQASSGGEPITAEEPIQAELPMEATPVEGELAQSLVAEDAASGGDELSLDELSEIAGKFQGSDSSSES